MSRLKQQRRIRLGFEALSNDLRKVKTTKEILEREADGPLCGPTISASMAKSMKYVRNPR